MASRLGAAVAFTLALGACGGGDDASVASVLQPGSAATDEALSGPSSTLADGFVVADGAALIGAPVPLGAPEGEEGEAGDDGWTAYLYVDGDPGTVVRDFLAQAQAQGLVPVETPAEAPFPAEGAPVAVTDFARCGVVEIGDYRCEAAAIAPDGSPCFTVDIVRSDRYSHARVRFAKSSPWYCPALAGVAAGAASSPPPLPTQWPTVPAEGAPFGQEWGVLSRISVQKDSTVVATAIPFSPCEGPVAVLEATNEPGRVLDRYVRAFEDASNLDPQVSQEVMASGGRTLDRRIVNETAGGAFVQLDLVSQEGKPSWLYLHGCQG